VGIVLAVGDGPVGSVGLGEVRLPRVFGSHMVLQREAPLAFWGWANPGETVTVEFLGASGQAKATSAANGSWCCRRSKRAGHIPSR
jgi:hypothetical protein